MKRLINRRGEGYIIICVLIVALCMLLSVFITFVLAVNTVQMAKRTTRSALDAFVIKNSIEIFNSIKNGNDEIEVLDSEEFTDYFCALCKLDTEQYLLYNYDKYGNEIFRMTKPQISFTVNFRLKVEVQYTLYIPLYFNGVKVTEAVVPVTVESRLNEKF